MIKFYCFSNQKLIAISDKGDEYVKQMYGFKYEILTSIADRSSLDIVLTRLQRTYPGYNVKHHIKPAKRTLSDEVKRKMSLAKLGKKHTEETKRKTSLSMRGKKNHLGKLHTEQAKENIGKKQIGNTNVKNRRWAYDPRGTAEIRIPPDQNIPVGFTTGRDYYSTEAIVYLAKAKSKN